MVIAGIALRRALGLLVRARALTTRPLLPFSMGALLVAAIPTAQGQIAVTGGGTASYTFPINVPPGLGGMSPNIGLTHSGGGVNGPVGYGWSIQGISNITRCPQTRAIDGFVQSVSLSTDDKLCLDGQRLIQTDANGVVVNGSVINPSRTNIFQSGDSLGGTGTAAVREYRTEKDSFARIRAYGSAAGTAANGLAYFKVWTKSGQVYEYGDNSNATAKSNINAQGKSVIGAWAVSRISDTLGNYIDFQYDQRDAAWGSGPSAASPTLGHEWSLMEIRYTGNTATAQTPRNKVVFSYIDRVATPAGGTLSDRVEAYQQGVKNISVRRLQSITTFVNTQATPVQVKTIKLNYDNGPTTGRSRLQSITECAGSLGAACTAPILFEYAPGGGNAYAPSSTFNQKILNLLDVTTGNVGIMVGDFNSDGRTDFIRWSDTPAQNQLFLSAGNGTFNPVTSGSAAGQFNINDQNLFKSTGNCYSSAALDFNGDGFTDILRFSSCPGNATNYLYLGQGDGSFVRQTLSVPLARGSSQITHDCLNGDPREYPTCAPEHPVIDKWSPGANYYLLDVNGDGFIDIVTTTLPAGHRLQGASNPAIADPCATTVCTRVYLGSATGAFQEITTNLANRSLYSPPGGYGPSFPLGNADLNGDGLMDIAVVSTDYWEKNPAWISRGDGNFDPATSGAIYCSYLLDFNGDGNSDCLTALSIGNSLSAGAAGTGNGLASVGNFNLNSETLVATVSQIDSRLVAGITLLDLNGDGRADILRYKDNPLQNEVFLSNGDGTFSAAPGFNLKTAASALRSSDGTSDFVVGDFTGRGQPEILRMKSGAIGTAEATTNQLYVKANNLPADQLLSVTSSSGLKTTLTWVPLSNSASGTLGSRYKSDRNPTPTTNNPNAAVYPKLDLNIPMYVVATSVADSGVGASTVTAEYSYAGLKAAFDGRGLLGFRETRRQSPGTDSAGSPVSVLTQYLQTYPYTGVASSTITYLGNINVASPSALSTSTYTYCDKGAAAGAEAVASPLLPCPTSAKLQRPYVVKSVESGVDLAGIALPTITTANTFDLTGNPTSIVITTNGATNGTSLGLTQQFVKGTTNTYLGDNIAGDNWVLGRLQTGTQRNTVPDSVGGISTSAGSAPLATAVQGTPPAVTLTTPSFANTQVGQSITATATLSNAGVTASWVTVPLASSVTGTNFSFVSTTCLSTLAGGASCTVVVRFSPTAAGVRTGALFIVTEAGTKTASLSATGLGLPTLALTGCAGTSPTTTPTAATRTCTLSNTGQTPASSIGYSGIAGATVSGPTGACAAGATCGTVTVTSGIAAATYNGTLTVTPNIGSAASVAISLVVNTPSALSFSACSSTSPTTPTAATQTCSLSNTGQAAVSAIAYSSILNATVSGPTGACAGGAVCGTVTVITGTAAGTYSGTLTATPNAGSAASTAVSLTVKTAAALALTGCSSSSPTTAPTAATMSCTLSNSGQTAISSIGYAAIAGASVSGPTGACAGNSTCGTVTVTSSTAAGSYSGTLTATPNVGSPASVAVALTVNTPAALAFSGCSSTSTTTPTAAIQSCTVSNTGQAAITSIGYSAIAGATVSGPTGACAGSASCGSVTVTTGTAAGTYSGTLTATPNVGAAASTGVSLTVKTPAALAFSGCSSVTPTVAPAAATMSCTLSNAGQSDAGSIGYLAVAGTSVNGPTGACAAGAACGTVTVTTGTFVGAYVGTLTATPNTGSAASTAVSLVVNLPAVLAFSACSATSPTTTPTAATQTCALSNIGQTAAGSISYSAIAGTTVSGPTGACAAGAACGTVTVTTSTAAGAYNGTLTATPNIGQASSVGIGLTVRTQATLAFSGCSSVTPTFTPTQATTTCTLSNVGQTALGAISYSYSAGFGTVAWNGPFGACAAGATCGTVYVASPIYAGTYVGTLTATPDSGVAGSTPVNLVVNGPVLGTFQYITGATLRRGSSITIKNNGAGTITGITAQCDDPQASGQVFISTGLVSTLAPGASMTVLSGNGGFGVPCGFNFTGVNASNSPYMNLPF